MPTFEIYAKRDALIKRLRDVPSDEEIKARAQKASTAFQNGELDKFTSLEELKKRHIS